LAKDIKMTKRIRMSISAGLLTLSVTAVAAAASSPSVPSASGPAALLTGALICIVLTLLVWSDELDRSSVRRSRAARRERVVADR
jgi:hypothetical protein